MLRKLLNDRKTIVAVALDFSAIERWGKTLVCLIIDSLRVLPFSNRLRWVLKTLVKIVVLSFPFSFSDRRERVALRSVELDRSVDRRLSGFASSEFETRVSSQSQHGSAELSL
mmetsp:Transcript_19227/g.44667  ORF Transcript_19227/g.44667 Transcript_19227/m.44667 type:complete len:113 (+) Transcript_19227:288-626(+)